MLIFYFAVILPFFGLMLYIALDINKMAYEMRKRKAERGLFSGLENFGRQLDRDMLCFKLTGKFPQPPKQDTQG